MQYASSDAISLRLEDDYFRVSSSGARAHSAIAQETTKLVNYGNVVPLALVFQFLAPSAPPARAVAARRPAVGRCRAAAADVHRLLRIR